MVRGSEQTHKRVGRQAHMAAAVALSGLAAWGQAARAQAGVTTAASTLRVGVPHTRLRFGGQNAAAMRNWHGKFIIKSEPSKDPALAALWTSFQQYKGMQGSIASMNAGTVLPRDVPILFGDGGGKQICEYIPGKHVILVSYEFMQLVQKVLAAGGSDAQLPLYINGAMHFCIMHEMGHAFIHEFNIPALGREEDVADQFATVCLMVNKSYDVAPVMAALFWGKLQKLRGTPGTSDYADVHSLDKQRCYNLLTWMYGSDPKKFAWLVQGKPPLLPPERARGARQECEQMALAWEKMLNQYVPDEHGLLRSSKSRK